jgi:hypothetical protein
MFELILEAYKKLKSHVYYDNHSDIFLRKQLAEFENDPKFLLKIQSLVLNLEKISDIEDSEYLKKLLKKIDYVIMPKKWAVDNSDDECYITNNFEHEEYEIESVNTYIIAPVELHIIATAWVMGCGSYLDTLAGPEVYANRLYKKQFDIKLFKPYFNEYKKWRDKSIEEAKKCHERGQDVVIFSLDFQKYYYSVDINFQKLREDLIPVIKDNNKAELFLKILEKIVICYSEKLRSAKVITGISDGNILPIGILSSNILANWYLYSFDKQVKEHIRPLYYGRYVDDLLIVMAVDNLSINKNPSEKRREFLEKYLTESKVFREDNDYLVVTEDARMKLQKTKRKIFLLEGEKSGAFLDNFIKNIESSSSEYRLLLDDVNLDDDFISEAYSLIYTESSNKLRNVKAFDGNRFGISKYLAKLLFFSQYCINGKEMDNITKEIMRLFDGKHGLELNLLWEKIFAFLIVQNRKKEFYKLYIILKVLIGRTTLCKGNKKTNLPRLQKNMKEFLDGILSMSLALDYEFCEVFLKKNESFIWADDMRKMAQSFRKSNLLRHSYVPIPLLNFTNGATNEKFTNLLIRENDLLCVENNIRCKDECNFELDEQKKIYSPRFIQFYECVIFCLDKSFRQCKTDDDYWNEDRYWEEARKLYQEINGIDPGDIIPMIDPLEHEYKGLILKHIQLTQNEKTDKINIGVVNTKVHIENIKENILGRQNLSAERLLDLFKILNMATTEKCDMIVLPEVFIPYTWLPLLARYSRDKQCAIVCGLEHKFRHNREAYNFLATIVPFKDKEQYHHSLLKLRNKNHYSPSEIELLVNGGMEYREPKSNENSYDIFNWKGISFTCFNCFELADIQHRAAMRAKVDMIIAVEYNKDTNYYSNIAEAVSRDVHCYFVQVNSSDYGDSRIVQPTDNLSSNVLKLKGGENNTLLVGCLNIGKLRSNQILGRATGKKDKGSEVIFKPIPPNFDRDEVRKRMNLRPVKKSE